jgi:hypothetical protein
MNTVSILLMFSLFFLLVTTALVMRQNDELRKENYKLKNPF